MGAACACRACPVSATARSRVIGGTHSLPVSLTDSDAGAEVTSPARCVAEFMRDDRPKICLTRPRSGRSSVEAYRELMTMVKPFMFAGEEHCGGEPKHPVGEARRTHVGAEAFGPAQGEKGPLRRADVPCIMEGQSHVGDGEWLDYQCSLVASGLYELFSVQPSI